MANAFKRLARVLKVAVAAGAAIGIIRAIRGSKPAEPTGQASWQPLVEEPAPEKRSGPVQFVAPATTDPAEAAEPADDTETAPGADASWVEPVEGTCPATHPIKGNAQSGIFHVPSGMSYDRTIPERCYATEADAEADGFRKAKR